MADAPEKKDGHQLLLEVIGFFVGLIILLSAISGSKLVETLDAPSDASQPAYATSGEPLAPSGDFGFWQSLFNSYKQKSGSDSAALAVGTKVYNKGTVQVRKDPGGSVIGFQKRGAPGKIIDGPVAAYGTLWFMVDYENTPDGWVDGKNITASALAYYGSNIFMLIWEWIQKIGYTLALFFLLVIVYVLVRERDVPVYDEDPEDSARIISQETDVPTVETIIAQQEYVEEPEENTRWNHVELLMKSHNPSDWKQAVIEADVLLEEMLEKMGYHGITIGDKLKNVEESDFLTLDKAWEAHKVRNRIAHDGGGYKLSYDEARRVIALYHDVFKEFYWV